MPNESNQIHVIGIDTSNVESFFEAKKKNLFLKLKESLVQKEF